VSRAVIGRVYKQRDLMGLSTRALAERVARAGYPITSQAISAHETQPGARLTVDYVFAAAKALYVSPSVLLGLGGECRTCRGEPPAGFTCNACGERTDDTR